jgi:hypothetical protein
MIVASPDNKWISVAEACDLAGCTDGWIRHLLRAGRLGGFQVNEWTWMVDRSEAAALRKNLSSRSNAAKQAKPSKPAPKRGSRKSA